MQSSIIAKLLALLTIVSQTQKPMTFSELVAKSGMNKSTLHRLLSIGIEENMIQFDAHRKVYMLGPKVFDLVRNAYSGYDIQAVALDEMMRLHALVDANVTIGVPSGMDVVYLRILESSNAVGSMQRPGMREPVHCSASGKVLMAFLPPEISKAKLADHAFTKFTDRTITNAAVFEATLPQVREAGFATNDREEYDHLNGISAPVFNYMGEPIAVLNLWTVYAETPLSGLLDWADELKASAARVTKLIGGEAPEL